MNQPGCFSGVEVFYFDVLYRIELQYSSPAVRADDHSKVFLAKLTISTVNVACQLSDGF